MLAGYDSDMEAKNHCVKNVQDLLLKSPYSVRIRENTDPQKTPYLDTFHAVIPH